MTYSKIKYRHGKVGCLGIAALMLLILGCGRGDLRPGTKFSLEELQADYRQLRSYIADSHPKTFTDWRDLASAFDRQEKLLQDGMTALEFRRIIAPAVAAVRCGHTRLSFSDDFYGAFRQVAHHLPLDIRVIHDSLFVFETYFDSPEVPSGSTVLSINEHPASEIITTLRSCLPADGRNQTFKDFTINGAFRSYYLFYVENPDQFAVEFLRPGNSEPETATLLPMTPVEIASRIQEEEPDDPDYEIVEWTFDDSNRYAELKIHFFDFYDDLDRFVEMIDGFFQEIRARDLHALILDLRGNDGGDPYSSAYLLTYLMGEPFRYFSARSAPSYDDLKDIQHPPDRPYEGELYVLVDGGCFSTTGHFCSLLRFHLKGVFIGEETGGSFVCNGGYKEVTLDNTRINLLLPHTTFRTDVRDMPPGEGIPPDYQVTPTIRDLIDDQDPVFDTAVALIENADS